MVSVPCELENTKVSRNGPSAKVGRSGGDEAAPVLTNEPESLVAPARDISQVPSSGQQNCVGWARRRTGAGGDAALTAGASPAIETAQARAVVINRAFM